MLFATHKLKKEVALVSYFLQHHLDPFNSAYSKEGTVSVLARTDCRLLSSEQDTVLWVQTPCIHICVCEYACIYMKIHRKVYSLS